MKPLRFIGSSLEDLTEFPIEARRAAGHELWQVQLGFMPSDFKPMPVIGPGCVEIRIHAMGGWRVIYVARFGNAVHVLHAFHKKTQQTRRADIELARNRYRQVEAEV